MVDQVEISEILDKLSFKLEAKAITIFLSQDRCFSTSDQLQSNIWLKFQNIKQPKLLDDAILIPFYKKNSFRVLIYIEKSKPHINDAMQALTWMLNNVNVLEVALKLQVVEIKTKASTNDLKIMATPCSPGMAMGRILRINVNQEFDTTEYIVDGNNEEISRLSNAIQCVVSEMQGLSNVLASNNISSELFHAYCNMLERHGLLHEASELIIKKRCSAEYATNEVIKNYIKQFQSMTDPYLRSRTIDLKDIRIRILRALNPSKKNKQVFPNRTILVAEDISPLTIAEVPIEKLAGIVCTRGSKYSHASILARALGVPLIIDANDLAFKDFKNAVAIIDGYIGSLHINPPESSRRNLKDSLKYEELLDKTFQNVRSNSSETGDGTKISLQVNVGLGYDIQGSLKVSADGVGLFRTEVPFMMQSYLPNTAVQSTIYSQVLKSFHPKPVVIRTLDIGGDKRLPYLNKNESNPYLGTRGFRFSMEFPAIFRVQVEAIMLANEDLNNASILLPMITCVDEVLFARDIIDDVKSEFGFNSEVKLGIMIEVPGVVSLIEEISNYVDFFSVGTNDLTQYLLAVDRNNMQVADLYNSWHPAVLSCLDEIVTLCNAQKKSVSVCGELAGDPIGSLLLLAIGYRSLSMNHKNLLKVKWLLRQFTTEELSSFWQEIKVNLGNANKIMTKKMLDRDFGRFVSKR